MKVSLVPLSPTVLMVLVMEGYLYMLDRPGLSNNSKRQREKANWWRRCESERRKIEREEAMKGER